MAMSDNPLVAAPVVVQPAPAGDTLPIPTPEQERTSDQLFAQSEERHAAADLIGMVAAVQFLHDLGRDACHHEGEEEDPALPTDKGDGTPDEDE
jgi:hypothetical protein